MAPNDIKEKLARRPFHPLRVYLSDGGVYEVPEAWHAAVSKMEMWIGVDPDEHGVPTRAIYSDPRHITRIEPLASTESGDQEAEFSRQS